MYQDFRRFFPSQNFKRIKASKIFKRIKTSKSEHVNCVYKVCKYILDNLKRRKKNLF